MKAHILSLLLALLPIFAFAQNYEQRGDEYFVQAQYDKALKQYNAAEQIAGSSDILKQKQVKSSQCAKLLANAQEAETNNNYSIAAQYYADLYAIHPLASYNSKATSLKQKAAIQVKQQEQAAQAERQLQAQQKAASYIEKGDQYFNQQNYSAALSNYNMASELLVNDRDISAKVEKTKQCLDLLNRIKVKEGIASGNYNQLMEISNSYNKLYSLHPLATYKHNYELYLSKAKTAKAEAEKKAKQQQEAEERRIRSAISTPQTQFNLGDVYVEKGNVSIEVKFKNEGRQRGMYVSLTQLNSLILGNKSGNIGEPYGSGSVTLILNPGKLQPGKFHEEVVFRTNAKNDPIKITIDANIIYTNSKPPQVRSTSSGVTREQSRQASEQYRRNR